MKRPDQVKTVPNQGAGSRVPPGQFLTKKFPVLTYGPAPKIAIAEWRLRVFGLAASEVELNWEQISDLRWQVITADFHCVTQWSQLDNSWEGVSFADVVSRAQPLPGARFVMVHCHGGYSTNLPLELAMREGIFAHKHNGRPLGEGHGWPLRLVIPSRYGWKSAKWVSGIELLAEDAPGFWEQRGYNNSGDPWKEERFWPELTG
jgi:DMSO/TMAO reductase YedYZ molybdopterin-dependent catalytic subunit